MGMASDEDTEYGGSAGIIQPATKGHANLTAREKRFVNAVYRKRMAGIDTSIPPSDLHRPAVDAVLADLNGAGRTAGRTPDEAIGESVS